MTVDLAFLASIAAWVVVAKLAAYAIAEVLRVGAELAADLDDLDDLTAHRSRTDAYARVVRRTSPPARSDAASSGSHGATPRQRPTASPADLAGNSYGGCGCTEARQCRTCVEIDDRDNRHTRSTI